MGDAQGPHPGGALGFDLAIFNFYFGVKENPDGSFTYDISGLARNLDYWKTLGSSTPVAIGWSGSAPACSYQAIRNEKQWPR